MATSSVLLIGKETDTVRSIAQALAAVDCHCERARGSAGAIRCLRQQSFDVVITDPDTTIDEGLALIEEMRDIRPGMKAILLDVLQLSGLPAGDVKESRNENPTRDLQMAADRTRPHTLCGPVAFQRKRSTAATEKS
jgi:CheY-like chemotaxis protein